MQITRIVSESWLAAAREGILNKAAAALQLADLETHGRYRFWGKVEGSSKVCTDANYYYFVRISFNFHPTRILEYMKNYLFTLCLETFFFSFLENIFLSSNETRNFWNRFGEKKKKERKNAVYGSMMDGI